MICLKYQGLDNHPISLSLLDKIMGFVEIDLLKPLSRLRKRVLQGGKRLCKIRKKETLSNFNLNTSPVCPVGKVFYSQFLAQHSAFARSELISIISYLCLPMLPPETVKVLDYTDCKANGSSLTTTVWGFAWTDRLIFPKPY